MYVPTVFGWFYLRERYNEMVKKELNSKNLISRYVTPKFRTGTDTVESGISIGPSRHSWMVPYFSQTSFHLFPFFNPDYSNHDYWNLRIIGTSKLASLLE